MADRDFHIKVGDLEPAIEATLEDGEGNAVDIENATAIEFHMRLPGATTAKVDAAATKLQVGDGNDGSKGKVRYAWIAGDTDTAGLFNAEFEVTFPGPRLSTIPNDGHLLVEVTEQLA